MRIVKSRWPRLLPFLLLLPYLGSYIFLQQADFSDLLTAHLPNLLYLKDSLLQGRFPAWSAGIFSGFPFLANPLSGLWYPPGWLAVLLPEPWGINLALGLHLIWGMWGMQRFLEGEGLSTPASLFGGLAFSTLPKVLAHLAAGHLTLVYAIAWTPWLLLANSRRAGSAAGHNERQSPGSFGLILGLIFLADVRWALFAGIIMIGQTAWQIVADPRARPDSISRLTTFLAAHVREIVIMFIVILPFAVPFYEFLGLSTRANLTSADNLVFSLEAINLVGFLGPVRVHHEFVLHAGAMVFLLALLGLFGPVRKKAAFWYLLAGLSLMLAFGDNLPGGSLLYRLPPFNLTRVPGRWLFVTGLSLSVVSAYTLQALIDDQGGLARSSSRRILIGYLAVPATLIAVSAGQLLRDVAFSWPLLSMLLAGGSLLVGSGYRNRPVLLLIMVVAAAVIDSVGVSSALFRSVPADELPNRTELVNFLAGDSDPFRTYSPDYSLPQDIAARAGIQMADGVDPLQLASYTAYLQRAGGFDLAAYSVILPPSTSWDTETRPDLARLGRLNVKYVLSASPLPWIPESPVAQVTDSQSGAQTFVYANPEWRPRLVLDGAGSLASFEAKPGLIAAAVSGPGRLLLSEVNYPGWQVRVDGERQDLLVVDQVLMAVDVPPGDHTVEFRYVPVAFYRGVTFSALLLGLLIGLTVLKRRREQHAH
jgi:hypothetical protein